MLQKFIIILCLCRNKGRKEEERGREGGCMVITESEKAFAAGADITEMQPLTFQSAIATDSWVCVGKSLSIRTPLN